VKPIARLLFALALTSACLAPVAAQDPPPVNRTPVDDATFALFAERYEYDHNLPLHAKVLDTRIYNGRELPYAVDKINFRSVHDAVVTGFFAHPRDSTTTRYPAVILLHGNNGSQGTNHIWGNSWIDILGREKICVLAIDAYGFGERMLPEQNKDKGQYEWRAVLTQQVIDTRRAIDYLYSRPEVDTTKIALMGESMGGMIGIRVAGLEKRFATVVFIVMGSREKSGTDDKFWGFSHSLNFAPRISAPVLTLNATQDQYFSRQSSEDVYALLPDSPKQQIWQECEHVILVEDQRKIILPWLEKYLR
jgi:dienelactone hydrolase